MNEETSFNKRYPEFNGVPLFPYKKQIGEIIDKHFVSRKHLAIDNIKYGEFQGLLKYYIPKQDVKDAFIKFIKIDKEKRKSKGDTWDYGDSMMELRLFELAKKLKIDKKLGLK